MAEARLQFHTKGKTSFAHVASTDPKTTHVIKQEFQAAFHDLATSLSTMISTTIRDQVQKISTTIQVAVTSALEKHSSIAALFKGRTSNPPFRIGHLTTKGNQISTKLKKNDANKTREILLKSRCHKTKVI